MTFSPCLLCATDKWPKQGSGISTSSVCRYCWNFLSYRTQQRFPNSLSDARLQATFGATGYIPPRKGEVPHYAADGTLKHYCTPDRCPDIGPHCTVIE